MCGTPSPASPFDAQQRWPAVVASGAGLHATGCALGRQRQSRRLRRVGLCRRASRRRAHAATQCRSAQRRQSTSRLRRSSLRPDAVLLRVRRHGWANRASAPPRSLALRRVRRGCEQPRPEVGQRRIPRLLPFVPRRPLRRARARAALAGGRCRMPGRPLVASLMRPLILLGRGPALPVLALLRLRLSGRDSRCRWPRSGRA